MKKEEVLICNACQLKMEPRKTSFQYLGHSFATEILGCPECREVYIPEELVKTRMSEVEKLLEDK